MEKIIYKILKTSYLRKRGKIQVIKNLFEKIKTKSKIEHFSSLLQKHHNNSKETWKVIKEAIGKSKLFKEDFPKKYINK